jgi:hypothetical protein
MLGISAYVSFRKFYQQAAVSNNNANAYACTFSCYLLPKSHVEKNFGVISSTVSPLIILSSNGIITSMFGRQAVLVKS